MATKSLTSILILCLILILMIPESIRASESIKIGVVGPMSGDLTEIGTSIAGGVKLYTQQNRQLLGKDIELFIEDDVGTPAVAVNVASKLVNNGVSFVIGHGLNGTTKAASKIYDDAGIICVSPTGSYAGFFVVGKNGANPFFYKAYAAAMVLSASIKDAGTTDYGAVKESLRKVGRGKIDILRDLKFNPASAGIQKACGATCPSSCKKCEKQNDGSECCDLASMPLPY